MSPIPVTQITDIVGRSQQGKTKPFIAANEYGQNFFLKGHYAGAQTMCREWIASRLARAVGLHVPDFCQAEIPPRLARAYKGEDAPDLKPGTVFASKDVPGLIEVNPSIIPQIEPELRTLVLYFDWWIQNDDRTLSPRRGNPNLGWSPAGGLVVYDFNLAFDEDFDPVNFWQDHIFRDEAKEGFDLEAAERIGPLFEKGLARFDTIWHELPFEWLHPTGNPEDDPVLHRDVVYAMLNRFQITPTMFWTRLS